MPALEVRREIEGLIDVNQETFKSIVESQERDSNKAKNRGKARLEHERLRFASVVKVGEIIKSFYPPFTPPHKKR